MKYSLLLSLSILFTIEIKAQKINDLEPEKVEWKDLPSDIIKKFQAEKNKNMPQNMMDELNAEAARRFFGEEEEEEDIPLPYKKKKDVIEEESWKLFGKKKWLTGDDRDTNLDIEDEDDDEEDGEDEADSK